MWNHRWPVAAVVLCLQCGGSAQSAPPVEEPENETPAEPPAEEAPAEPAEEATPSSDASDAGTSASGDKKPCTELDKSTCKITTGCVWNDVHKCVEEGAGE